MFMGENHRGGGVRWGISFSNYLSCEHFKIKVQNGELIGYLRLKITFGLMLNF